MAESKLQRLYRAVDADGMLAVSDAAIAEVEAAAPASLRLATAYTLAGNAHALKCDYRAAVASLGHATRVVDGNTESSHWASVRKRDIHFTFANTLHRVGRTDEALSIHMEVLASARNDADRIASFESIARCHVSRSEYLEASRFYAQSLDAVGSNDGERTMKALRNMGNAMLQQRKHEQAYTLFSRGHDVALQIGHVPARGEFLVCMAECKWMEAFDAPPSTAPSAPMQELSTLLASAAGLIATSPRDEGLSRRCMLLNAFRKRLAGNRSGAMTSIVMMLFSYASKSTSHCWGCGQKATEQFPLLSCGLCRIARFCCRQCQSNASKRSVEGTCAIRHRHLCPMLRKHRMTMADSAIVAAGNAGDFAETARLAGELKTGIELRKCMETFLSGVMERSEAFAGAAAARATAL